MYCFFFFFSSRRRHTRLQGDWSSDVCSSDLSFDAQSPNAPGLADIIDAAYLPVDTPVTGYNARMAQLTDRKSTRLNSSHLVISYAVFCLKKKKSGSQSRHRRQTRPSRQIRSRLRHVEGSHRSCEF